MSNSYNVNSILCDPASTVAGRKVTFETPERMSNALNYAFAAGNCENVLSHAFADRVFITDQITYVEMAEYRIPLVSLEHDEIEFIVNYRTHGSVTNCNIKFTLTIGVTNFTSTLSLSSTTNGFANNDLTITYPSGNHYYGTLKVELQANSASEIEIFSIMAYFKPLSSPLSAGRKNQYNTSTYITPFGTTRTTAQNAFTSRFAHNMIDSISEVRKRLKSLVTWSGVYNTSSTLYPNADEAATSVIYVGVGHMNILNGFPLLPSGFENLDFNKLELHVRAIGDVDFTFFGQSLSINQASSTSVGWHTFDLEIDNAELLEMCDSRLPYYKATFDQVEENRDNLISLSNARANRYPPALTSSDGTLNSIIGLSLFGV